jgi:hypothetical protein
MKVYMLMIMMLLIIEHNFPLKFEMSQQTYGAFFIYISFIYHNILSRICSISTNNAS